MLLYVNYIAIKLGEKIKGLKQKNKNWSMGPEKQYGLIYVKHIQSTEQLSKLWAVTIV